MRTFAELKELMLDCFDADNMEMSRAKFQSQLTDEELQMLRDHQAAKQKAYADLAKEYKIGLIGKNEYYNRCNALDEKYAKDFV